MRQRVCDICGEVIPRGKARKEIDITFVRAHKAKKGSRLRYTSRGNNIIDVCEKCLKRVQLTVTGLPKILRQVVKK